MRATILMCLFVVCAALSVHYVQLAYSVRTADSRSDPLVAFDHAFRMIPDDKPATRPAPAFTHVDDFYD